MPPQLLRSVLAMVAGALGASVGARGFDGGASLALVADAPALTFAYAAPAADARNWVGVYGAGWGGPDDDRFVAPSLAWAYAPARAGRVRVVAGAGALEPGGAYRAYLLAADGYRRLAPAVDFVAPRRPGAAMAFLVDAFTTHNARAGDAFAARVAGLLVDAPDGRTRFAKVAGADWLRVAPDGSLAGVPDAAGTARLTVEATGSDGARARLAVAVPVRAPGGPLVDRVAALSLNLWEGGRRVDDGHRKHVRYLAGRAAVDVVGLQESGAGEAARLGRALGWHWWQGPDVGILSRYPIAAVLPETAGIAGAVRIDLGPGPGLGPGPAPGSGPGPGSGPRHLLVWSAHLAYTPYGPYDFCFDRMRAQDVLRREETSGRGPQIRAVAAAIRPHLAGPDRLPVLLMGDFNAPSHLDWTLFTAPQHCGVGDLPWPTSVEPARIGLVDSFRQRHPDPVAEPANTWSPVFLDNEGRPEPLDRIDFIYYSGLDLVDSATDLVGRPRPEPNHQQNEWASDHAAVRSVFRLPSPGP